jgi:hypothetical protein
MNRKYGDIICAPAIEERYAVFLYFGSDDPQYPDGGWAGARGGRSYLLKKRFSTE